MKNYRRLSAAIFFLLITLLLIISLTESARWLFLLSALMPIFVVAQVVGVLMDKGPDPRRQDYSDWYEYK
ncbi:MAG: hypothetical protein KDC43_26525 [Saprospiraceae bacterium]|nr:hypothetical protein [Saprospiraceae bacterium]